MRLGQSVDWPVSRCGKSRLRVCPAGPVGCLDFDYGPVGVGFLVLCVFGYQ